MARLYATLYERLVANTELAVPDNPQSCWLWTGALRGGRDGVRRYPYVHVRIPGGGRKTQPVKRGAHRAIIEETHDVEFPHDEAGHLCYVTLCIHPDHLEPQTLSANAGDRSNSKNAHGCMIPVLYPRFDALQAAADAAFEDLCEAHSGPCPF